MRHLIADGKSRCGQIETPRSSPVRLGVRPGVDHLIGHGDTSLASALERTQAAARTHRLSPTHIQ